MGNAREGKKRKLFENGQYFHNSNVMDYDIKYPLELEDVKDKL